MTRPLSLGFEQLAIEKLLAGETSCDEVETDGEQRYLRAATVVMDKCIMCHENNRDVPRDRLLALSAIAFQP